MTQICLPHWDRLKLECKSHDLAQFVAKDGADALMRVAKLTDNNGVLNAECYEPLMGATLAINHQVVVQTGQPPAPNKCPLCEVEAYKEGYAEEWIKGAMLDQLEIAQQLGLIGNKERIN